MLIRRAILLLPKPAFADSKQPEATTRAGSNQREAMRPETPDDGAGPITALAFLSAVDDPARFKHAKDVGPYLGLTPTRYQSGETDRQGRISKCGDTFVRTCLHEAASVLLTRVQRFSPLKAWGMRLVKRICGRKAWTAVARKLPVILHCIWVDGAEFRWSRQKASMA